MSAPAKRFRRGLVVGKFAPLHRGHELLIRRALEVCDEVVVLSYSKPELDGCSPERRAHWLATRFPQCRRLVLSDATLAELCAGEAFIELPANAAPPAVHQRFVGFVCRRVLRTVIDAVFTSEAYGDDFARELGEDFRRHGVDVTVVHMQIDAPRDTVPISGSAIRADVHAHRRWLAREVYASFVRSVCVLGGESSGKTTLARALATVLGTVHVPEFGRHLWESRGGKLTLADMDTIVRRQVALEYSASLEAEQFLVCDTSPLTTLFYSQAMFGSASELVDVHATRSYDLAILCAPDFPFVQDGTRRGPSFRARQHRWYLRELRARGLPWMLVSGSVEARIRQACTRLGASLPWGDDAAIGTGVESRASD